MTCALSQEGHPAARPLLGLEPPMASMTSSAADLPAEGSGVRLSASARNWLMGLFGSSGELICQMY